MTRARALERLPRRLDVARSGAELALFGEGEWIPSPSGALGGSSIPLVSPGGTANHDFAIAGPARPTAALERSPALKQVIGSLGVPVSRSRLVRLAGGTEAPKAAEWSYHWFRRAPICIPLIAAPTTEIECGDEAARMAPGEAWLFDTTRSHRLRNPSPLACVHLIVETKEPPLSEGGKDLLVEPYRFEVLSYDEIVELTGAILGDLAERSASEAEALALAIERIRRRWKAAFERFGHRSAGELAYQDIVLDLREEVVPKLAPGSAGARAAAVIDTMLWVSPPAPRRLHRPAAGIKKGGAASEPLRCPDFDRPLIVVSAPRAGSTLFFDLLSRLPEVWTIGTESHELIRAIPEIHPAAKGYSSDRLTEADASPAVAGALCEGFARRLVDRSGRRYIDLPAEERPTSLRLIEKTPANALRIPFLRAVFPDALFVYLYRDPRENISSLVEGWRSRRFLSYRGMPGWPYRDWSFLLPPGWSAMEGRSLVEIAAYQWKTANTVIEEDLRALPEGSWRKIRYEDLVQSPREVLLSIAEHAGLGWDDEAERAVSGALPLSRVTLSAPSPDKWRRHEEEIMAVLPSRTPE